MKRRKRAGCLVAAAGTVIACAIAFSGCNIGIDCTAEVAPSAEVTLEDSSGSPIFARTVEYRTDGESGTWGPCDIYQTDATPTWPAEQSIVCGYEEAGLIEIRATSVNGETGEAAVYVRKGECHVRTVEVTIVVE